jgi:hypothetical protein
MFKIKCAVLIVLFISSMVVSLDVQARGRTGSHRHYTGGSAKGNHYVGGH